MTKVEELDMHDREEGRLKLEKYRFTILRYIPNPAIIQNEACEWWNIPNTTRQWDLIDHVERKFVSIEVSEDLEEAKQKFLVKISRYPGKHIYGSSDADKHKHKVLKNGIKAPWCF